LEKSFLLSENRWEGWKMIVVKTYADVLALNDAGTFLESFRGYVEGMDQSVRGKLMQ
jgi:hypothetical protein